MHKHHQESIENMAAHYRQNPEIIALFLVGSVATGTERPDPKEFQFIANNYVNGWEC